MEQVKNAFEFLEKLRAGNEKQAHKYSSLAAYLGLKAREKGIPVSGQFELTPLCNFNCGMCYVRLSPDQVKENPLLTVADWKAVMLEAWEAGMLSATLTGGECLAYPGFEELFLYLHSLGCEVAVLTNGSLLDDRRIRFFREHKPSGIHITLYGWNDDVYERVTGQRAFKMVSGNIRKAIGAATWTGCQGVCFG